MAWNEVLARFKDGGISHTDPPTQATATKRSGAGVRNHPIAQRRRRAHPQGRTSYRSICSRWLEEAGQALSRANDEASG